MPDIESYLTRWLAADVVDSATATRIRAYEADFQSAQKRPAGLQWQSIVALILGAMLLAAGVILFVNAHWDEIGQLARFALVLGMVTVFHLAGGIVRQYSNALSTTFHAIGTVSTGAAIALVGQIFNIEEHWPAAILMWAIAAAFGWALLRDQAQQILTLLLFPAWLFSEWEYYTGNHHGGEVYLARMIATWAALYLTFWLTSKHKAVWGLCFTAGAIALIVSNVLLLEGWAWYYNSHGFLSWGDRIWGWILIAALPLLISLIRFRLSLLPVVIALLVGIALPFCQTQASATYFNGTANATYTHSAPSLIAHALIAAFAGFLAWWGVRQASKTLVNYGIVAFAVSIVWFFFADIFSKMGRSVGLIALGILFVAGGWALEKTRRRLVSSIPSRSSPSRPSPSQSSQGAA
jgi:uncharacterized membrane protein